MEHSSTYELCVKQIAQDKKKGTQKCTLSKLDLFLLTERITEAEYAELVAMISE